MLKKIPLTILSISLFLLLLLPVFPTAIVYSQNETSVRCGEIIDGQFGQNAEEHIYLLTMQSRESFEVTVQPVGDFLKTVLGIYGPSGLLLALSNSDEGNYRGQVSKSPKLTSGILSAKGIYKIRVTNTAVDINNDALVTNVAYSGGIGDYALSIGCTKSNGSKIEPGDGPQSTPTTAPLPTPTVRPGTLISTTVAFKGAGFPGLAPVDFSDVAPVPLKVDRPMGGVLPLDNQILGFTLDAKANDVLDLSYERESGNLNIGIVVLSATNKVVFQASLVTSESLATRFTLPEAGKYTIGVFRINLVNPDKPQPTAFQLLAKLNAK
ncbi:MAG: PPC domain-containing protein [Caldilineaceae bacterium]